MDTRPLLAALALLSFAACGKKEPESNVQVTTGDPAATPPTMPNATGAGADYQAAKACCDALMATPQNPEDGDSFRRAAAACAARAASGGTKADVIAAIQPIVTADKLPPSCR